MQAADDATVEQLNKLTGQVQDLIAAQEAFQKKIDALQSDVRDLHDRLNAANTGVASQDDLKRLADKIEDVDRKRVADYERIVSQIEGLGKVVATPPPAPKERSRAPEDEPPPAKVSGSGYEYVIKRGDRLSVIAQAYREKNIKVTVKDILDANPGLNPDRLRVGQKIFIPAPKP